VTDRGRVGGVLKELMMAGVAHAQRLKTEMCAESSRPDDLDPMVMVYRGDTPVAQVTFAPSHKAEVYACLNASAVGFDADYLVLTCDTFSTRRPDEEQLMVEAVNRAGDYGVGVVGYTVTADGVVRFAEPEISFDGEFIGLTHKVMLRIMAQPSAAVSVPDMASEVSRTTRDLIAARVITDSLPSQVVMFAKPQELERVKEMTDRFPDARVVYVETDRFGLPTAVRDTDDTPT
jgi:hypothetical protein